MKDYIFVRHGESHYNIKLTTNLDSELTPRGVEQAVKTGRFLRDHIPDIHEFVGITSPYHRCLQTSDIIHSLTGIDFQVKSGPREIMMSYDECKVVNRKLEYNHFHWHHEEDFHFFMENEDEFVSRMRHYILEEDHPKLLVVSHGSVIKAMYDIIAGQEKVVADLHNYPDNCSVAYIQNQKTVHWNHLPWA